MHTITLPHLITELIEAFPELQRPIEELGQVTEIHDLYKQNEYAHLVFEYIFNPFLLEFLESEKDTAILKRLFDFFESMAQSTDMQVVHVLVVIILKALSPAQYMVAQKYMGAKTVQRNRCMWDKDELESRFITKPADAKARDPKYTWATCYGNLEERAIADLEYQLSFTFDPSTRAFLQAIGNLEFCYYYANYWAHEKYTLCTIQVMPQCILSVTNNQTVALQIMRLEDKTWRSQPTPNSKLFFNIYADGHITVTDGLFTGYEHSGSLITEYASLAHLVEELIMHAHFLATFDVQALMTPSIDRHDVALLKLDFPLVTEDTEDIGNYYHYETYIRLLPECNHLIQRAYTYAEYNYSHYKASPFILLYVISPLLKHVLANMHGTFMRVRLFYFLEKIAETQDPHTITVLKEGVFARLTHEELHTAQELMGPRTKELLP